LQRETADLHAADRRVHSEYHAAQRSLSSGFYAARHVWSEHRSGAWHGRSFQEDLPEREPDAFCV